MSKGRTEQEFWTLTPRQLFQFFKACEKKSIEEYNSNISLAWQIAWLGFHDPKKLPKLKDLFIDGKPKKKQTAKEMEMMLRSFTASLGGKILEK